jgi:hypothetical protein
MVLKFQLFFKFVRICQWKATPGDWSELKFWHN